MGNRYKIPFELGTWAGLAAFAYFMLIWFSPYSPLGIARYGGFWIPILFVFLSVSKQRKAITKEEEYTFGNAFMTGMLTVMVLGIVKGILVYMMLEFVDINLIHETFAEQARLIEKLRQLAPENAGEMKIKMPEGPDEYPSSQQMAYAELNLYFMGGIPVSLLAALIFKKRPQHA